MRTKLSVLLAGFGVLMVAAVPVLAHHAFGAEFDPNRPVLLKGKVTRVEWVNPHAWIHIAVVQSDGTTEEWMVEGGTPNTLRRRGITRGLAAGGHGEDRCRRPMAIRARID